MMNFSQLRMNKAKLFYQIIIYLYTIKKEKMKFSLLSLALLLIPYLGFGQSSTRDSLLNLLISAEKTEIPIIYRELADEYVNNFLDSALFFAQKSLESAQEIDNEYQVGLAHYTLGNVKFNSAQFEQAILQFSQARTIFTRLKKEEDLGESLLKLGMSYSNQNNFEEALNIALEAKAIGEKLNDPLLVANALQNIATIYFGQNKDDEALETYNQVLEIYEELGDLEDMAIILSRLGSFYSAKSEFERAIEYYQKNLEIKIELDNKRGIGIAYNNLGNQYLRLSEFDLAIENYKKSLEIFKEIGMDNGTAASLTGMAVIYEYLKQYESALEVHKEVLEIRKKQDRPSDLANTNSNIAITYSSLLFDTLTNIYGEMFIDTILSKNIKPDIEYGKEAIRYNTTALEIRKEINDIRGLSITLPNLGNMYLYMGEMDKAEAYFTEWLQLPEDVHDNETKIATYLGLGKISMYRRDFNTAKVYFNLALRIADKIKKRTFIEYSTNNLAEIYARTNDFKEAYFYHKRFHNVFDSLNQEQMRDQISEMQVKYETEAKEKENELLRIEQEVQASKLKNSRNALIAAILVVLVFVGLVIQLIRQNAFKRKANLELARKNRLITEQTKEITDSIQYASRIQNAVLPPEDILSNLLPEHFIIYRPRDIVSGDYFWITEKNNRIITIVADCTGHGVPGAFMSMLGVAYLNEIISKHDNIHVDEILNELRNHVIDSLHQTGREGENQDGMDVALYIIDKKTKELEFAGANNPLIIFRKGEMIELKPDKMPIGIHTRAHEPFTKKEFQLKEGDMLYAFSDGYADQFGGPQGKKFMIKNFRKLLLSISKKSLKEQKKILENSLDTWMKNTKQIDDIIVMGVRVKGF